MSRIKTLMLIPHIRVQNANALSSPYTIGFPAMTAWLGATHALQRKLNAQGFESLKLPSVAVISHSVDLQTYKGRGDYVHSIVGTANPLDRHGKRPAFIEEARCHLDVSLLIEYSMEDDDVETENALMQAVTRLIQGGMKIAGGDILRSEPAEPVRIDETDERQRHSLFRRLMPGYAIIERRELMQQAMADGQDAIDAMLDHLVIKHRAEPHEDGSISWHSQREVPGWIVPIATGFHALTPPDTAQNQRDPQTPHRFAESVVTLGQFIMPYRFESLDDMLWHYHALPDDDLYLCQQNNRLENH